MPFENSLQTLRRNSTRSSPADWNQRLPINHKNSAASTRYLALAGKG